MRIFVTFTDGLVLELDCSALTNDEISRQGAIRVIDEYAADQQYGKILSAIVIIDGEEAFVYDASTLSAIEVV